MCRCSFLEIYNEQIFDLLDPASTGLSSREDIKKGVFVDGLLERDVASARDAYRVFTFSFLHLYNKDSRFEVLVTEVYYKKKDNCILV